jgi:hypothetical protein
MTTRHIELTIEGVSTEDTIRYQEIFVALIASGGLSGVKGGKTIIHFDAEGIFQGIELDYWPWRRRKKVDTKQ